MVEEHTCVAEFGDSQSMAVQAACIVAEAVVRFLRDLQSHNQIRSVALKKAQLEDIFRKGNI